MSIINLVKDVLDIWLNIKMFMKAIFKVVDIYPEKSRYLPIILCRNDINDELF